MAGRGGGRGAALVPAPRFEVLDSAGRLSGRFRAIRGLLADLFYQAVRPIMLAAIAVHYRRAVVAGRERYPLRGAALIAANHPSTWSDVLLLEGLLGRRLHFLSESGQFRPWPRGLLLRLFGTLPVFVSEWEISAAERNEETFRRCRRLFDRGDAVAIFPEGVSRADRSLMPLRRGAARLAITHARRPGASRSFALVPVAVRYGDRAAFRTDATVIVGEPIGRAELRREDRGEEAADVDRLTRRIGEALRSAGALAEDPEDETLLSALEAVAAAGRRATDPASVGRLVRAAAALKRGDPARFAELRRHARWLGRASRALGVSVGSIASSIAAESRPSGWPGGAAMLAPAAVVGALSHAVPVLLAGYAIRRCRYDETQVAFARITAGLFVLSLFYAAIAWILTMALGVVPAAVVAILGANALCGVAALAWWDRVKPALGRRRLERTASRHPALVRRARRSAAALARWIEERDGTSGGAGGTEGGP